MIGEVLGNRYEIIEKIGEGGMAVVYKARCNKLNRYVAVKILKEEFCNNEDIVGKFTREATAIATLSDPNIVNVLDVGKQDNYKYIVMEYIQGKTLKQFIQENIRLNYETVLSIGIQIAKALDCAHKNDIIHRDVKPENILITDEGLVKVTDFGIAKSPTSETITTTTVMGSAHYFSPEQAKGSKVDARTDLYSLGVVLYEMSTGRLPFEADSPVSIALKHIQEEVVPPKQINSKMPNSLNDLIVKCLNKNPDDRYQSAKELVTDFEKIKEDPNVAINKEVSTDSDDNKTIIMPLVNDATTIMKPVQEQKKEEPEDKEDFYDEDYDSEEEEEDIKHSKNRKKIIIGILGAIAIIAAIFIGSAFAFSKSAGITSNSDVTIPTLTGKTLDEAKSSLDEVGLVLVDRGEEASDQPAGTVIAVDPKEGTSVKKNSNVNVITSSGPQTLTMKDFKGSDLNTVQKFLSNNGISYTVAKENSDTIDKGLVTRTDPASGTEISKSTNVTIYVSLGSSVQLIKVPSVIGLSESDARAKLDGFNVNVVPKEVDDANSVGKVVSQTNAGKSLESGSDVTIYIGTAKQQDNSQGNNQTTANVDSYINTAMTGTDAKNALTSKGYTVTIVGNPGDKVSSWSPTTVTSGGSVTITTKAQQDTTATTTK